MQPPFDISTPDPKPLPDESRTRKASSSGAYAGLAASVFLGVADFFDVAFLAAAVFLTAGFLVVAVVFDLVTRPDFVLPRILGSSTIAGAY